MLSDEELLRYHRQLLLPSWDIAGQQALADATVLVVGLGGLGSPVVTTLATAGVGHLIVVDDDVVEVTNLQRQPLHTEADVGRSKVASAVDRVAALNARVRVTPVVARWSAANGLAGVSPDEVTLVADCCDNFATRDALAQWAWSRGKPLVSAAAMGWSGQLSVFDPAQPSSGCYRCLFPEGDEPQTSCSAAGVMASTVAIMGSWQAQEILKQLAGVGRPLNDRLLLWDGWLNHVRWIQRHRDPACPVCSIVERT